MSVIHAPRQPELDQRAILLAGLCGIGLLGIMLRLWYVQVVASPDLLEAAERSRRSTVSKLAPRGLIYDRHKRLVAGVRPQAVVTAIPNVVQQHPEVIPRLAEMLGQPADKLQSKLKDGLFRPYLPTPIYADVSVELASQIAEADDQLPGVDVETQPMRYYPNTVDLAHILGYVWTPSRADLERLRSKLEPEGRQPAQYVGKIGLERIYERELMGVPGQESLEVDSKRRPVRVVGREPGTPGDQLFLALDRELQKHANAALLAWLADHPESGAALVAMEPNTGEVLALASVPSYDASLFVGGISSTDYQALLDDPRRPLTNRAIAGTYSPGSTFKMVTTYAAVRAGIFDPRRAAYCGGGYRMGRTTLRCTGFHGSVTFHRAMQQSCNAYFCDLGVRAGKDALTEAALAMGLGAPTGIDLIGEQKGIVPTDAWVRKVQGKKESEPIRWYRGNTAQVSIGQGDVVTTPLQMASVMSLVANRGVSYRPRLVRAMGSGNEVNRREPEVLHRVEMPTEVWDQLHESLRDVIRRGTGRRAQIAGVDWAGKTGSTETGRRSAKTHSWFVGFAPYDQPKIAIAVIVEQAGHGGEVAAPIAASVVKRYLDSLDESASRADPNARARSVDR